MSSREELTNLRADQTELEHVANAAARSQTASMRSPVDRIRLGNSELVVSRVGMGCWPIAGVSTLHTNREDNIATLRSAYEHGVNFFDSAYSYGHRGEADQMLAAAFDPWPHDLVLASKVGQALDATNTRIVDGRPETLWRQVDEILTRLKRDTIDLLYLHTPDPMVPISESAGGLAEIVQSGKARYAGVSNVDSLQLDEFQRTCPVVAVQPPYNMLQPEAVEGLRLQVEQCGLGVAVYWVLMKGLLAGKLARDYQFQPEDKRLSYPIYQGDAWQRAQDLLDTLRAIAKEMSCTVAQLVISWTLYQPSISVALCGAKRPAQIQETAAAMHLSISDDVRRAIDAAIAQHQAE